MQPNPLLKKLGFNETDRVVILHADDVGMCQASVSAFADLHEAGWVSSGAAMAVCPWFLAAADWAHQHPAADLGVHLTITSEWNSYRWGPLSTRDPASGMLDEQGYFYASAAEAQRYGDPAAVAAEIRAQVQAAARAGIIATHADTHMGALAHPKYIAGYLQLCLEQRLPPMVFRWDEAQWQAAGLDAATARLAVNLVQQVEAAGVPLLDHLFMMPLDDPSDRLERTFQALEALPPGVNHFIIHPSKDSPELRAITPDWPCRVADYLTFMRPELGAFLKKSGIQVIGYRAVQSVMPSTSR